jgi:hypothetical protein
MRLIGFITLCVLSLGVAGYAAVVYGFLPLGSVSHPEMRAVFESNRLGIYAHVFGSSVALALGPFVFSSLLRSGSIHVHRWQGRLYLGVGVLIGGLAGFYIALHAFGGTISRTGFAALAVAWLYSGLRAYLAIRAGKPASHRRWMTPNFAFTFAAVTLRLYGALVHGSGHRVRAGPSVHRRAVLGSESHRRGIVVQQTGGLSWPASPEAMTPTRSFTLALTLIALSLAGCAEEIEPAGTVSPASSSRAYKGHANDQDMNHLVAVYPQIAGSRLDDCQSCHTGGVVTVRGKTRFRNACDYCHLIPFPDEQAEGAPATYAQTLNPFGLAYLNAGRGVNAIRALSNRDSDGDSFTNEEEIHDFRYPGSAESKPGQPKAETVILDLEQLRAMPAHTQFLLVNSHRQRFDTYATYTGVKIRDLLEQLGVDLNEISGITIVAADGFMRDFDVEAITGRFPHGLFFSGLDIEGLGSECGFVAYPESLPEGLVDEKEIPGEQWLMLAYGGDGGALDPSYLDPATGRSEGEGPLRIVVPQSEPGPPDRGSKHSPSGCGDGYDSNESADHNAGAMVRGVVAIRINPTPNGYEQFDATNGGWAYVDAGQLVVYGNGIE